MLNHIIPENLFIFDIETVPEKRTYDDLPDNFQKLFDDKVGRFRKEEENKADYYFSKAGIYAEFGKVIVISCGHLIKTDSGYQARIKTLKNDDEKILLKDFLEILTKTFTAKTAYQLCGHNIKEFDVPWLCRRLLINGIVLPDTLDLSGKRPWEVNHVDTLELWKFGDYKHYTSLNLLASILNIATPKNDIDGSMVGKVYWEENNLDRIATYCSKDVLTVAQIILRMKGMELIREENIMFL
ncbi:MAG: 3'-5' exonuclease [Fimbriimonadaceae bacterium]|nr:3'-5' exonuclease [Chitinophagales bacterium]